MTSSRGRRNGATVTGAPLQRRVAGNQEQQRVQSEAAHKTADSRERSAANKALSFCR
jgi:hypothetical protein